MSAFYRLVFLGAALVVGSGCGVNQDIHEALKSDYAKLKENYRGTAMQLQQCDAELGNCKMNLDAIAKAKNMVEFNLQAQAMQLQKLQEEEARRKAYFKAIADKFRKMVESGKLQVSFHKGRMVVKLPSGVLFDAGKDKLRPEGKDALAEVAKILMTITDRDFQVAGHTDDEPIRTARFPSNWELSSARAVTVVKFLQEQGMTPTRLSTSGYAEFLPVSPNETADGRALNRRIEIILQPNVEELQKMLGFDINKFQP